MQSLIRKFLSLGDRPTKVFSLTAFPFLSPIRQTQANPAEIHPTMSAIDMFAQLSMFDDSFAARAGSILWGFIIFERICLSVE